MKKVSFDFDGTLEYTHVQDYARELIKRGIEVHIVTTRFGDNREYQKFFNTYINVDLTNTDLWEVAESIGIPENQVHLTNMMSKWNFFDQYDDFIWHLDDNKPEITDINEYTPVKGINYYSNMLWKQECDGYLDMN